MSKITQTSESWKSRSDFFGENSNSCWDPTKFAFVTFHDLSRIFAGRGLSEIADTGKRRNTEGEVNLSDLDLVKTLLASRPDRVKRSSVVEEGVEFNRVKRNSEDLEYGDYADYEDDEQDYGATNTSYGDSEVTTTTLP